MSLRRPRLSLSGSALPTALALAVARALRDRSGPKAKAKAKAEAEAEAEAAGLSSYWIPLRAVHYIARSDYERKNSTKVGAHNEAKGFVNYKPKPDQVVYAFGLSYVNAAETPVCSLVDSATCARDALPVGETGEILWALLKPLQASRSILFEGKSIKFRSPYWLKGNDIYTRWGVKPNSDVNPLCLENGLWFLNAEQTSDASIFDALSCAPHRQHQCITGDAVRVINWNFSIKLNKLRSEMKTKPVNEVILMDSQNYASNLWIDVQLIETLQWTLEDGAVGVEVPPHASVSGLSFFTQSNTDTNRKSFVIVNADFVVEQDALVSLIRYKPIYIGLRKDMMASSFTVVRLSLIASMKKYTSTTWIASDVVEKEQLCGRNTSDPIGVEVSMMRLNATPTKIILINLDELDVSPVREDELKVCYK